MALFKPLVEPQPARKMRRQSPPRGWASKGATTGTAASVRLGEFASGTPRRENEQLVELIAALFKFELSRWEGGTLVLAQPRFRSASDEKIQG
jgi:hypothetical protein